jgi:carbon dioxide concentrating mechanism protein CcmL
MRLGTVIGRVTLSQTIPELKGARWLVISPHNREHCQSGAELLNTITGEPSLVVYDNLGGGVGDTVGFVEGREAASPFDPPIPIDAINAALVDETFYTPKEDA